MFNIGPTELLVILIIALIVFGPKRLPEIGRTVGKSLREFRRASQDLRDELHLGLDDDDLPATSTAPGEPGHENWKSDPSPNGEATSDGQRLPELPASEDPAASDPDPASHPAEESGGGSAT